MTTDVSIVELLKILRKRILMILAFCISGVLLFSVFTFYIATPQYQSTSQLLVTHSRSDVSSSYLDINNNLTLINTYKEVIKGPVILEDVQRTLDLGISAELLSEQVEVVSQNDSQIFSIVVTDENPEQAALLANTIADTFRDNIWDIMNIDNVTIISRANPSSSPFSPNVNLNLAVGFMLSLIFGVGLAIILEWMDNTIKDEEMIAKQLGWSTLGEIIEYSEKRAVKTDKEKNDEIEKSITDTQKHTGNIRPRA